MNIPPLPDALIFFFAVLIPLIAIILIAVDYLRSHRYWKDTIRVIGGLNRAIIAFREVGYLGLQKFDLLIDNLSFEASTFKSPTAQALTYSIQDAKNVVCNEINLARLPNEEQLKENIASEIISLINVMKTGETTQSFEHAGRIIQLTMLRGKLLPINEIIYPMLFDENVVAMLIGVSKGLVLENDFALSEELGNFIDTQVPENWIQMSPLAILIIYWLRLELRSINSEDWYLEKKGFTILRNFWASKEELLSLSVASISLGLAEGDREKIVNEISYSYRSRKWPVILVRLRQRGFLTQAGALISKLTN